MSRHDTPTPRQQRIAAAYETLRRDDLPRGCQERMAAHAVVLDAVRGCGETAAVHMIGDALADICARLAKVEP